MNPPSLRSCLTKFSAFHVNTHLLIQEYYQFYNMNLVSEGYAAKQTIGLLEVGGESLVGQAFFAPKATANILLIHGYMDHTGLYGKIIRHLLYRNNNVFIVDLAGHGLSSGTQVSIDSFFDYIDAINSFLKECKQADNDLPWHLCGQSMGGALAMTLRLLGNHSFDKTVLLAPLVRPAHWLWLRELHTMLRPIIYAMPRSFHGNTHDMAFHEFHSKVDPLQTQQIPIKWVNAWRSWKKWFLQQPPNDVSMLVIQGTDDHTVDWRYGLEVITSKFPKSNIHTIARARHHMVNESNQYLVQIFQEIDNYCEFDTTEA